MKALVVGGNGFIGSHLVDNLVAERWDVIVLDLNQRRYDELPKGAHYIQGDLSQTYLLRDALTGVDIVYHLAWSSIHETSNQNLVEDIQANLIPTVHLLESCRCAGVKRIVFNSSGGTVYGDTQNTPIQENHTKSPINSYGVLKLAVEKYLYMFRHLYGLGYAVLRPSVPYGPRQNPHGRQGAVAVFLYRIWRQLPLTIWGGGQVTRDYFYVSDLVQALSACAQNPLGPIPVYNIGGGREISLLQLIEQVEQVTGQQARVEFQPARSFDAQRILLDTQRAQQELSWQPEVSFPEGLEHTWRWMRSTLD